MDFVCLDLWGNGVRERSCLDWGACVWVLRALVVPGGVRERRVREGNSMCEGRKVREGSWGLRDERPDN